MISLPSSTLLPRRASSAAHAFCVAVLLALGAIDLTLAADPTPDQLDRCRFGFDRGCRAGGMQRGLSAGQVDRGCGCALGVLAAEANRADVAAWCGHATQRRSQDEAAALAVLSPQFQGCFAPDAMSPADTPSRAPKLVGRWQWTRQDNQCTETLEYRADGTSSATSGDEHTEDRWTLSPWLPGSDSFRLTLTTTRDDGGRDCANRTNDDTGATVNVFLRFASDDALMVVCYTESGNRCYGPLRRVGE